MPQASATGRLVNRDETAGQRSGGGATRDAAFGQSRPLTPIDRLGVWLSARSLRRHAGPLAGRDVGDFGCGFEATYARNLVGLARSVTLVDVALARDLHDLPGVRAIEGDITQVLGELPGACLDVILCVSVLEHLWEPVAALVEFRRLLRPGGVCLVNVPSWLGKRFLEFSAFRLGLSPAAEMDDHKTYYDPKDLWPMLRRADFLPHDISCSRTKLGLNTFAACRVPASQDVAR